MNARYLVAGVAIAALAAGSASAKHHARHAMHHHAGKAASAMKYDPPAQPIPYDQLNGMDKSGMSSGAAPATGSMAPAPTAGATPPQ